jgi:hypothetical protein
MVAEPRHQVVDSTELQKPPPTLSVSPTGCEGRRGEGQKPRGNHYCAHMASKRGTTAAGADWTVAPSLSCSFFPFRFAARPEVCHPRPPPDPKGQTLRPQKLLPEVAGKRFSRGRILDSGLVFFISVDHTVNYPTGAYGSVVSIHLPLLTQSYASTSARCVDSVNRLGPKVSHLGRY